MNFETNRFDTFTNWPNTAEVDPTRIAKAGFYYTGQGVEVQCFSCGGKISEWNYGDQVMARHRRLDAHCPFVVDPQASGNVALVYEQPCTQGSSSSEQDFFQIVHDYGLTDEDEMYKSDALRLLSFVNFHDNSISREELVSTGFYHSGNGHLRCAWCGGDLPGMRRLGSLGTALQIHRRYFPGCYHAAAQEAREAATVISFPADLAPHPAPPTPRSPPRSPSDSSPSTSPPSSEHSERQRPTQSEGAAHNSCVLASSGTWRALGVVGGGAGARHPSKASLAARIATYDKWPTGCTQAPLDLANAGFFYTGLNDQVRCFYCDGGLGRWEASDEAWREHARWFPSCQYLLLVQGRDFVDKEAQSRADRPKQTSANNMNSIRMTYPITGSQLADEMENPAALTALSAGLDAARVRRALWRRMKATGAPFASAEALIDAVLDEQLGEEAWPVARDLLAETLLEFAPAAAAAAARLQIPTSNSEDSSDSRQSDGSTLTVSHSTQPMSSESRIHVLRPGTYRPSDSRLLRLSNANRIEGFRVENANRPVQAENRPVQAENTPVLEENRPVQVENKPAPIREPSPMVKPRTMSLEEENRQLREARLCKVCMDSEVSVVFLPCGHLAACAACGAGLAACPLCRARVLALVRAYLA